MSTPDLLRLLALGAIWGASFLFGRVTSPVLGAAPVAFCRIALAAVGLIVLVLAQRVPLDFRGRFRTVLLLGVVSSGLPFLMFGFAAQYLPAGYSAIFNATTPLMGILMGALAFQEPATPAKLGGVVTGLFGVFVLTRAGPLAMTPPVLLAVGACLVATACYGLSAHLTKRWIGQRGGLDSRLLSLGSQLGALIMLLPAFVWHEATTPVAWSAITPGVWGALLALGLLCTGLAYVLYYQLLATVGPIKATTVTFVVPFFGVLWGAIFLQEQLSLGHALGGGLIALALWLVLKPSAPARLAAA